MLNISKKIEEKIKDLSPKPKWNFVLKDYLIWGVGIVAVLIGALAFSVIIYMVLNSGWDLYSYMDGSFFSFVLVALPYFWIFIMLLLGVVAYYEFKHTKSGYKFQVWQMVLTLLVASFLIGSVLYGAGMGEVMDEVFSQRVPAYRQLISRHRDFLNQPEKGLLSGVVIEIDNYILVLQGFDGQIWKMEYPPHLGMMPPLGSKIWIMGAKTATSSFEIQTIKPFRGQKFLPPKRVLFERK